VAAGVPRLWRRTEIVDRRQLLTPRQLRLEHRSRLSLINDIASADWDVIVFLAQRRLIANESICVACRRPRFLRPNARRGNVDGYQWRCASCASRTSVRAGSFFARHSRLSLKIQILLLYEWSNDSPIKDIERECNVSHRTAVRFCRRCRNTCIRYCQLNPVTVGGVHVVNGHVQSRVVEIDDTYFSRRKYNRGRFTGGVWVFGGIDRLSGKCFFEIVPTRNWAVLFPIIQRHVEYGTLIISDMWAAYRTLPQLPNGYSHEWVDHSVNFVDPVDPEVHTQNIEALWCRVKRKYKRMCGKKHFKYNRSLLFEYTCKLGAVNKTFKAKHSTALR